MYGTLTKSLWDVGLKAKQAKEESFAPGHWFLAKASNSDAMADLPWAYLRA